MVFSTRQFLAKELLSRVSRESRIIFFCISTGLITGIILQKICKEYLKHYSTIASENILKDNSKKPSVSKRIRMRGGELISTITMATVFNVITLIAEHGTTLGFLSGCILSLGAVSSNFAINLLYKASPQNLPVTSLICLKDNIDLIHSIKLDCTNNFVFLSNYLLSKEIPYEQKQKNPYAILSNCLNLNTNEEKILFIICLVSLLSTLFYLNPAAYYIILEQLLTAVREGKLSKELVRTIIRRIIRLKGIPIDPELTRTIEMY
jgi:hypothetical protein